MQEHEPMTPQQRVQLNHVAKHLHSKFHGIFSLESIEAFVFESYDEIAKRATVTKWLTVTAEKFALQRLEAMAHIQDHSGKRVPAVLFLCVHNAGRSQMALGWFNHLAAGRAIAWSGGSEPGTDINQDVVNAMAEIGIDISKEFPKPWTEEFLGAADVVVTMGCGDACPLDIRQALRGLGAGRSDNQVARADPRNQGCCGTAGRGAPRGDPAVTSAVTRTTSRHRDRDTAGVGLACQRKGGNMSDLEVMTSGQRTALRGVALELHTRFAGMFGEETIEALVIDSFNELAKTATVTRWLVLGTQRFAEQRLRALIHAEDRSAKKVPAVLFLCVHNAGRSQMALGWFKHLAGARAIAWSGGSAPGAETNQGVVAAMAEVGIDIAREFPKPWTDEFFGAADVVVTMGCGDACPLISGKHYEDWDLQDPTGKSLEAIRPIREEIRLKVEVLLNQLNRSHQFS